MPNKNKEKYNRTNFTKLKLTHCDSVEGKKSKIFLKNLRMNSTEEKV